MDAVILVREQIIKIICILYLVNNLITKLA